MPVMRRLRYWFAMWRWFALMPPYPLGAGEGAAHIDLLMDQWDEANSAWENAKPLRKDFGL